MTVKVKVQFDAKGNFKVLDEVDNKLKSSTKAAKGFGNTLSTLNGFLGAQAIIGGLKAISSTATSAFSNILSSAADLEKTQTQFRTLTGSVAESRKIIGELQSFTASTPFRFDGVTQSAAKLIAFGVETKNVVPLLRELGDVASGSGADLGELALIFGQVRAAGKLTGERLLQLEERATGIGAALAKNMGVAETSIRDLVSKGKVSFDTFKEAFFTLNDAGGKFFESTIRQSKTLTGIQSTLADNVTIAFQSIGEAILPVAKIIGLQLLKSLQDFTKWVKSNQSVIRNFTKNSIIYLADAIEDLTRVAGFLGRVFKVVFNAVTASVRTAALKVVQAMTLIVGAVKAAGSLIGIESVAITTAFETLKIAQKKIAKDIKTDFDDIGDAFSGNATIIEKAGESIRKTTAQIKKDVKDASKSMSEAGKGADLKGGKSTDRRGTPLGKLLTETGNSPFVTKIKTGGLGLGANLLKGAEGARAALGGVADLLAPGLGGIVTELSKGPDHVKQMVREFTKALPILIENVIASIPIVLQEIAQGFDVVVERMAERSDVIIEALVRGLIKAAPSVAIATAQAMAVTLPKALLGQLKPGFSKLGQGVGDSASGFIKKIGQGAENFFNKIIKGGEDFIKKIVDGIKSIFEAIFDAFKGLLGGGSGGKFQALNMAVPGIGRVLKEVPVIGDLISGGSGGFTGIFDNVFGSFGGSFGRAASGIGDFFGFADGADIPMGFDNDTFGPAFLSSGEAVITRGTTEKMNDFIDNRLPFLESSVAKLSDAMSRPMSVSSSVQLNEREFANIILELNRTNTRLAI